ncbi:helix-turn-helix domain-containing protein [Vallitalea pronyensis]|uniref:Helix-turn-helix domain-containing protein n=1 Tax=Vallitalea pronyensis TaxID=1348613 RepID=A0A8J8MLY6_9FIRM|nr:helix-turn-helix domain-containing protein [Vallitalea pronyensis]QUI23964.1 helix-turn-helix domain-containing protein [Vallitalea pronyensis]
MNYLDMIQNSINYIEINLKTELSASELARATGFSLFHYYRLFQSVTGIPVMHYILKRKLTHAIYDISLGQKMIDVALSYGFETHSGFFKAFKREYNCSPTEYLKTYKAVKPYKINLIREECIMISHRKIKKILKNWDIKEPVTIHSFYNESSGHKLENTWVVNHDYFMKVGTNIIGLKQHIALSKSFKKEGLESAIPVPTIDNEEYVVDGDLYYFLTYRVQGECIKSDEIYKEDSRLTARYIGEIIGQLHVILEKHDKEFVCNEPNLYESVKNWAIPEAKKYTRLPNSFYEEYLENFSKFYPYLPRHIIHRDPNPSNIMMKDGRLVGFIDFELSERNIRIFDPCYAATSILSESFIENDDEKLRKWLKIFKHIIMGYDSICKLSKEEKLAIPYIIYSIQLLCIAYFNSHNKFGELARVNSEMLCWLYNNKELLIIK